MADTPGKTVNRRLQLVDPDTGEVENRDASWQEPGKRGRKGKRMSFAMIHTAPEGIGQLRMPASQWQVLWQVLSFTNPETHDARIGASEIAENLGIAQPNASRALAAMVDRRILIRLGRSKYRINTHIAYRGSAEDWGQAYYSDPEPIWETS